MFSKKSVNKSHNKNQEPLPKGAILIPPEKLYIPESHFVPDIQYAPNQQQQYMSDQQQYQDNQYMLSQGETGYMSQESAYLPQEVPYYSPDQQTQGNQQMDPSANMQQQQQLQLQQQQLQQQQQQQQLQQQQQQQLQQQQQQQPQQEQPQQQPQRYHNTMASSSSSMYHNISACQPPHVLSPTQLPHNNKPLDNPSQFIPPNMPRNDSKSEIYPIDSINVKILFDGYSKFVDGDYFANCTCSLIKGGPNIVIDTMTVWDEEKLVRSLRNEGLTCDDIDFVICTHGHSDHTGCNHLFKNAIHIVGFSISHKDQYYLHPDFRHGEEFNIDPSTNAIKIIPTPGHTLQDVTILVYTNIGVIAITGDLFEKAEDLENDYEWLQAGSDNAGLQRRNRQKVLELADYIIPGHGPIFKVPDRFKKTVDKKAVSAAPLLSY